MVKWSFLQKFGIYWHSREAPQGLVLKKVIFDPFAVRIRGETDSLKEIKRFPKTGIEGWLKVEVVAALGKKILALKNRA